MENTQNNDIATPITMVANKFLSRVFGTMGLGLFVSALTSFVVLATPAIAQVIFGYRILFYILLGLELLAVIYLSRKVASLSLPMVRTLFYGYAILNGVTLSVIFMAYELTSILSIFVATAAMFAGLAFYGAHTNKDLTSAGKIAIMGLFGIIIASVINLFIGSSGFDFILSWIGVVVFAVLTAHDVQKIKAYNLVSADDATHRKASIMGALTLYLDFINLFLDLLRLFGKRK